MVFHSMAHSAGGTRSPLIWPFIISFAGHLLLFGILLFHPVQKSIDGPIQSVIDVQMVNMPSAPPAADKAASKNEEKAAVLKSSTEEPAPADIANQTAPQAEVSVAPLQHKPKTALKYRTFKSKEVLKSTLERLEKKVDRSPPKPLEDTIKRLREQVARQGRPEAPGEQAAEGTAQGQNKGLAVGSRQEGEAIDLYRLDVAYAINKNWAFSEQLAGGGENLVASVVFKIMPDGKIEDIFFTDRSGNAYLDDSAMKAIMKSSPVKPHPAEINRPYIELGLRFTPKGVQ